MSVPAMSRPEPTRHDGKPILYRNSRCGSNCVIRCCRHDSPPWHRPNQWADSPAKTGSRLVAHQCSRFRPRKPRPRPPPATTQPATASRTPGLRLEGEFHSKKKPENDGSNPLGDRHNPPPTPPLPPIIPLYTHLSDPDRKIEPLKNPVYLALVEIRQFSRAQMMTSTAHSSRLAHHPTRTYSMAKAR